MPYLIDTDLIIDHLGNVPRATELLARLAPEGVAISVVTYMEAWQGVLRSPAPEDARQRFEVLLSALPVLPFSEAVARRTAHLREDLRRAGRNPRRRALDLMIAATALEHEFTLVTRYVGDYRDIPGLELHDADEPASS